MGVNIVATVVNKSKMMFAARAQKEAVVALDVMNRRIGKRFASEAAKYPPENDGNRPPYPLWERGVGKINASGRISVPSQQMGDNWNVRGIKTPFGGQVTVSNPTTYAPWVHDDVKQANFHARNGWRTMREIANAIGVSVDQESPGQYSATAAPNYMQEARDAIGAFLHNLLK